MSATRRPTPTEKEAVQHEAVVMGGGEAEQLNVEADQVFGRRGVV